MRADTESSSKEPSKPVRDLPSESSLTDVMDQIAREKLERWVNRRHAAVPYRLIVESFRLTSTKSS